VTDPITFRIVVTLFIIADDDVVMASVVDDGPAVEIVDQMITANVNGASQDGGPNWIDPDC
jgi:hypothetical protein